MPEIKSHTALRGIAALLVVIFHFRTTLIPVMDIDAHTQFFANGYLWVDCFFMLSGFILCYVYGTRPGQDFQAANKFLLARFARIWPLHAAMLLTLATWQIVIPQITHQLPHIGDWSTFLLNALDIHAWGFLDTYDWNFPSWSISVEFAAYLSFPIVCLGLIRFRPATLVVLALMVPIGLSVGRDGWERTAVLHGLPMFFAGILIFQCRPASSKVMITIQATAALVLVYALHSGFILISTLCFAALVFSTQTDAIKVLGSKPLQALGEWSYSIYMLHIPVRLVVGMMLGARLGPIALFVVMLLATICLGALSHRFFEMPMRRAITSYRTQVVIA